MSYSILSRRRLHEFAEERSQLSELDTRPLRCSHNTHLKGLKEYDDTAFGLLVTDIEHYAYHLIFRKEPYVIEVLGLTYEQNLWSLNEMWKQIMWISDSLCLTKEQVLEQVEKAKLYWYAMLAIDPIEA